MPVIVELLRNALKGQDLNQSYAVAVSGGADSMALVLALKALLPEDGKVIALHVDHRLRPESSQEAGQVKAWLENWHIPCHILTIMEPIASLKGNIQANARKLRYGLLTAWCQKHNISCLMTAHHQGDQAETVLMRLARGSGIEGLQGIAPLSVQQGITLLRPLLKANRTDIEIYLCSQGQCWLEDPSNSKPVYQRNRWRRLMPLLAQEGLNEQKLADIAGHMRRAADYLHQQTMHWITQHHVLQAEAFGVIPAGAFCQAHEEIALRVLKPVLSHIAPLARPARFDELIALYQAMQGEDFRHRTLQGCVIVKRKDSYYIARELARLPAAILLKEADASWDGRYRSLLRLPDMMLGALGAKGLHHLRAQKVRIPDLPATVLHGLPTLFHLEVPVAVPHIDYYRDSCNEWKQMKLIEYYPHCPSIAFMGDEQGV